MNYGDSDGWTSLHFACLNGHLEAVKVFLQDIRVDVNKQNTNGETPRYFACQKGNLEVVKHMVQDQRVDVKPFLCF